jgi:hypothetical protein
MNKAMKAILSILIISTTLVSCLNRGGKVEQGMMCVLNKKEGITYRWNTPYYDMYIYNGTDSKWYSTDQSIFNKYSIGDTINTLIISNE